MSELWLDRYKHNEELRNIIEEATIFNSINCGSGCEFIDYRFNYSGIGIKNVKCRLFQKVLKIDIINSGKIVFRCEECKRIFGE